MTGRKSNEPPKRTIAGANGPSDEPGFAEQAQPFDGGARVVQTLKDAAQSREAPSEPQIRSTTIGNLPPLAAIKDRTGNYLLTYGHAGAGKTTFQSHLIRWIAQGGDFVLDVANNDTTDTARVAFNNWMRYWNQGQFPPSTVTGEENVVEMRFRASPKSKPKSTLEFNILEMSGEDQNDIVPDVGRQSKIMAPVREYLANRKIKFMLVMVLDPDNPGAENDIFFLTLLDYLEANFPGLSARMSLLLLLSKPETALANLRSDREAMHNFPELATLDRMSSDLVEYYFERFTPATFGRLENWPGEWASAKLRVGDIVGAQDGGKNRNYSDVDYEDISKIFAWIYETFTGTSFRPSVAKRLWDALGSTE